jgi:hypothetical protein
VPDRSARHVIPRDGGHQILPVPLGGMVPARRRQNVWLLRWRRHQAGALAVLALAAAGFGVWLSTSPRGHVVSMNAGGVRVDDVVLTRVASAPYAGFQLFTGVATLALNPAAPGMMRGGAVMSWNGHATTGRCVVRTTRHATGEACEFSIGTTRLTAADTFDHSSSTWHRRYSDGVEIAIAVPVGSALIPVPFPVGH